LRVVVWLPVLSAVACTSALKEPPPVAELAASSATSTTVGGQRAELMRQAEIELARSSDPSSVARARDLYLEVVRSEGAPPEAFFGACRATAWLVEHEEDAQRRKELVTEGVQIGQWCARLHPEEVECTYRLALAVGQQARERSSTAVDGLDVIVELLEQVIAKDPLLDFAGGHRVLALVLLRAPGWPTGPGDPETGLEHARTAARAFPDHPPNQLVLGEALRDNGEVGAARQALQRGVDLARASGGLPEADEWALQGEQALRELP
jgi:hypothetical protein